MGIKGMTIIVVLTTISFTQELLLSFLPNIQLTGLLFILYSKTVGFKKTAIIIILHVLLDNLVMGSFNLLYTPAMLLGWMIIPITLSTIFKAVNKSIPLAFLGIMYAFIYSWMFIPFNVFIFDIPFIPYLMSDLLFEIILAMSNFLAVLLLYDPLKNVLDRLINEKQL